MKPVVSVIVPVYNVEEYLPRCLESLLGQTLSNMEILCVDDASLDHSAAVVREYTQRDNRVRLLQQEHKGVSAARNLGMDHAQGEFVAFVDADDWVESTMLETLVSRGEDWDVAVCSAQVHYEDGGRREPLERALTVENGQWNGEDSSWNCLKRNGSWPFVWNKLYRRALLMENNIRFSPELALGEDGAFLVLLWQYVKKVAYVEEKLYHYRYQRKASATVELYQNQVRRYRQHVDVVQVLLKEFSARDLLTERGTEVLRWGIGFLYYDFVRLPAQERASVSKRLRSVLEEQRMSGFSGGLKGFERRRLENLVDTERNCSRLRRSWDIWQLRIENRVIK